MPMPRPAPGAALHESGGGARWPRNERGKRRVFLLLLLGFSRAALGQPADERLWLESAVKMEHLSIGGQEARLLDGEVKFRQGDTHMICDRAIQYLRSNISVFRGNVHIWDARKSLRADVVHYDEARKRYRAQGHVQLQQGRNVLTARRVIYDTKLRQAFADSSVKMVDTEERLELTSEHAEYERDHDYLLATIGPVLIRRDSTGDVVTRITGEKMESFERGKRFKVSDNVRIIHQKTEATCAIAEYLAKSEKVILQTDPIVWQGQEKLVGDSIELYLEARKLKEVHVIGRAKAISKPDTTGQAAEPNTLTSQRMIIYLQDEEIDRVLLEGAATTVYNLFEDGKFKGVNRAQGDHIELFVENGSVQRARVHSKPGISNGRFLPPGVPVPVEKGQKSQPVEPRSRERSEGRAK